MIRRIGIDRHVLELDGLDKHPGPIDDLQLADYVRKLEDKGRRDFESQQELLQQVLLRFGALTFIGREDQNDFMQAASNDWRKFVQRLGGDYNRIWIDDPSREGSVRQFCETGRTEELDKIVDLVVTGVDVVGDRRGFTGSNPPPELAELRAVHQSETIQRLSAARDNPTWPSGSDRTLIWARDFAPLVRLSAEEVTVLDGYLLDGLNPKTYQRVGIEHVTWLLDRLDEDLPAGAQVRLFATLSGFSKSDVEEALRSTMYCRSRPGRLHLYLAPWSAFDDKKAPHDRHIRFSCGAAIDVNAGLDRFREYQRHGAESRTEIRDVGGYKCHYIGPTPSEWATEKGSSLMVLRDAEVFIEQQSRHWVFVSMDEGLVRQGHVERLHGVVSKVDRDGAFITLSNGEQGRLGKLEMRPLNGRRDVPKVADVVSIGQDLVIEVLRRRGRRILALPWE